MIITTMNHPRVGVGVIVTQQNKVLLGKRRNSHGDNTWCFPGGHLEFGESIEACAIREVLEETGLHVTNIKHVGFTNDIFVKENKHYVTCFVNADYQGGTPAVMEPDKCNGWEWFEWGQLPQPLFAPIKTLLEQGAFAKFLENLG